MLSHNKVSDSLFRRMIAVVTIPMMVISSFFWAGKDYSDAATNEAQNAVNQYRILLERFSFDKYLDIYDYEEIWYGSNCQFSLAYINDDDIPELLVYNTVDGEHATGWGMIYSYNDGEIGYYDEVSDFYASEVGETTGYYEYTGWYMKFSMWQGYGELSTGKWGTDMLLMKKYVPGDDDTPILEGYYEAAGYYDNPISEKSYYASIKNNTKGKQLTPYQFHSNTALNRDKYLTTNQQSEDTYVSGDITVKYNPTPSKIRESEITGFYSDDFFSTDNSSYNKDIAEFSLLMTMASMTKWTSNRSERDEYIRQLFEQLKFGDYIQEKYDMDLDDTSDTVAYSMACKTISGENVMAVAIRSGNYGGEWASNGRVGSISAMAYHYGFYTAAINVLPELKRYANEHAIDKIWICGYSRGGAVSNILGKLVLDNKIVPADGLYCYTFETPMTTHSIEKKRGIYNTISLSDPVPQVPLLTWGFTRYGTNMYIFSSKSKLSSYKKHIGDVVNEFYGITGNNYKQNNLTTTYLVLSVLNAVVGNETNYTELFQPWVPLTLRDCMGGSEKKFLTEGKDNPYDFVKVLDRLKINTVLNRIWSKEHLDENCISMFQQHWPEATYAWLKHGEMGTTNSFKYISILGSVSNFFNTMEIQGNSKGANAFSTQSAETYNVRVLDKNNKLVAKVDGGDFESFAKKNPEISLDVTKGINGETIICLPDDNKYSVQIEVEEDMTIDYRVTEMSGEGNVERSIVYNDIPLSKDETLYGQSDMGIGGSADSYDPNIEGRVMQPDLVLTPNETATVQIDTSVDGGGVVTGAGKYANGEKVILRAFENNGSEFLGWYENGKLIGVDDSYLFIAKMGEPRTITGKFDPQLSAYLSNTRYAFTAKKIKPEVIVLTNDGMYLEEGKDFTVTYCDNKYLGKAIALVKGIGEYKGFSETLYFTIYLKKPAKGKIQSVKVTKKKKAKIRFKKLKFATSYEICVWSNKRDMTIYDTKKTSFTTGKLKKGKTYRIKARGYVDYGDGWCVGKWSKVRSFKVK